jgi:hypothetical protein
VGLFHFKIFHSLIKRLKFFIHSLIDFPHLHLYIRLVDKLLLNGCALKPIFRDHKLLRLDAGRLLMCGLAVLLDANGGALGNGVLKLLPKTSLHMVIINQLIDLSR